MRNEPLDSFTFTDADDLADSAHVTSQPADGRRKAAAARPEIEEESLIEEVSIDGMCGVY
ncbi:MAG: mycofactocin precursor [Rhodospirillales bacterium]|nr:mycofactocin precursor [Rhodospirillales bacterium]